MSLESSAERLCMRLRANILKGVSGRAVQELTEV